MLLLQSDDAFAVPIVVSGDENGFSFEVFHQINLIIEFFNGRFSFSSIFFWQTFWIDIISKKNYRTVAVCGIQMGFKLIEYRFSALLVSISGITNQVETVGNFFLIYPFNGSVFYIFALSFIFGGTGNEEHP